MFYILNYIVISVLFKSNIKPWPCAECKKYYLELNKKLMFVHHYIRNNVIEHYLVFLSVVT